MKSSYKVLFLVLSLILFSDLHSQTCSIPSAPVVSGSTLLPCVASGNFTLTATPGASMNVGWYSFPYGGNAISTNSVFVTPTLSTGATYYVGQSIITQANASISLPGFVSGYSGNTRGMWFTAPTSFIITGLRVPTDVGGASNTSIALMKLSAAPPAYPTTTNSFTTLFINQNYAGLGIIPVYIPVYQGDVIGILGSRGNVTSYGSSGPFTASLGTSTLTLNRLGMQFPLSTTLPQDLWTEAASIGRIEVYTDIGCLSPLAPVSVTVTPSPQIIISGASSPICVGGTATLSASGVNTYSWSTGSNAQSIVVSPASSTTYTISGSLFPACASTAAITLSVNLSVPSITASASSNSVCLGNTVSLSGAGALTYTWSGGVQNAVAFSPTATAVYTVTGSNACGNSSSTIQINLAPLLIGAVSTSSLICSGSTATLTAAGASTYTWSPGSITGNNVVVSPIVNTVYTVQGTLGACLGSTNIAINTNPLPNLSVSASSSMICAGTSATLTASGGISYTWQPGGQTGSSIVVSPSIPTAYIVSGSNSFGCSVNLSQAVITNPSPTVSAVTSNSQICSGASATLTASGASTYSWSNGSGGSQITVSPVSTTLYSVTGTDANTGCSNTSTLLVNVFEASISVSQNTAICIGQSVSLNASGATSYTWSNGQMSGSILISPTITSVFVVNATSTQNGMNCASSGSVQVTVNPLPLVTAVSTRTNICRNESTIIQASGASGYLWSNSAVSPSISVSPTITTTYSVTGTDANGCTNSSSIQIKVFNCVGIYEFQTNNRSRIFVMPNPSGDSFTLKSDREETLEIVNTLGQTVRIVKLEASGNFEIRVGGLSGGTYLLRDCESKIYSNTRIIVMN